MNVRRRPSLSGGGCGDTGNDEDKTDHADHGADDDQGRTGVADPFVKKEFQSKLRIAVYRSAENAGACGDQQQDNT